MQPCWVIIRDIIFFAGILLIYVCLRFKFKFFNPERSDTLNIRNTQVFKSEKKSYRLFKISE